MAALPRNYQQTPGKFCACPGRRGRRPPPLGKVHHAFFRIHSGKLPAWSGAPHRWAKYITHFFVSIPASSRRGLVPPYRWARYPSRRDRGHRSLQTSHGTSHFFHVQHSKVSLADSGPLPAAFFLLQFLIRPQLLPPNFHSCSAQSRLRPTALCQPASSFSRSGASMLGVKVMLQCHRLRISPRSFHTPVARPAR